MGFWSRLFGDHAGITANENPSSTPPTVGAGDYTPGDPDGVELQGEETFSRSLATISPSPWDGWPADWATPNWQNGLQKLVDTAWACLDLNSSVLATMPVYRTRDGQVLPPPTWMSNPDPLIYASWEEFAKQLFWDYQLGEAFVLPMSHDAAGFPASFRVIPPWLVSADLRGGSREYRIGTMDVTAEILHIRYKSTTDNARGIGPLEVGGARQVASELLSRYMGEIAQMGGVTHEWIEVDKQLNREQTSNLREQYLASRQRNPGYPAIFAGGATLNHADAMSAKDMALLELAQFTESRIAIMCGVPPFLVGLPSGGDSMTYSNVSSLFDFHDRSSLRPKARTVMSALSGWAVPRGQSVELNRDEYSRPALKDRTEALEKLHTAGVLSTDEWRTIERLRGDAAAESLTGGGRS